MAYIKVLTTLMAGLAASACARTVLPSTAVLASYTPDERQICAEASPTGDAYRYCLEVGPAQARLEVPADPVVATVAALSVKSNNPALR